MCTRAIRIDVAFILTQDISKLLYDRALSYLNIDIAVYGNDHVRMLATPLLYGVIYKATNMVSNQMFVHIVQSQAHSI